jgi:methylthioribose-1-phosphate isomerase
VLAPRDIVRLEDAGIVLLDQTLLPGARVERTCASVDELIDAIRELAIRGAPALGVAGAMGVALAAATGPDEPAALRAYVANQAGRLADARPTAVNLRWGVEQALTVVEGAWRTAPELRGRLAGLAARIHADEVARCRAMGRHGAARLADGARIVTQCNTGALATGGYGSALGVVRALHEAGRAPHVWVPETRPLLQGARLTAWELAEDGIAHTLVTDNAVGALFAEGAVDAVLVGADRIAANGDAANKIGTYPLAVLARHHDVPFYVVAPSTTIDSDTPDGAGIVVEQRARAEVAGFGGVVTAPAATPCRNDAFDVTPAALITGIVTEDGVHEAPYVFVPASA